jgi:nucleoside 2-deoxyribosyltransferase
MANPYPKRKHSRQEKDRGLPTLKVYLASSFALKRQVQEIATILESKGIVITRKWWIRNYKKDKSPDVVWYGKDEIQWLARENFGAIDRADVVILVCPSKSARKFTGANIEVGYAIAKGKRVLSLGALERSAMYVPLDKHTDLDSLLVALLETGAGS